ncbi:NACHT domain-containing protein [Hassallia byssoidea VB512170]|uniref:NACHT domain-containing protein n=1 Tax=Hassallia byssoidea VB512170 TaxID=1304833 RepID=A0A846H826_9CYAN|nr:HEAT repeat domain-containing protein [Hassalia byssoidea]NEU72804.1 NACHT domain-containing protein [Hassalia byssoidea VB512170]
MAKHIYGKLLTHISLCAIAISSPLLLTGISWAQTSTDTNVEQIQQQKPEDIQKRSNQINALIKRGSPDAIVELKKALKDSNQEMRSYATDGLRSIGTGAEAALPDLIETLKKDPDKDVRAGAVRAIRAIAPEAGVPAFIRAFKQDSDARVRELAAQALGEVPTKAKQAIPDLIEALLNNPKLDVRKGAAEALAKIELHQDAVPNLRKALKDTSWQVRRSAAEALGNIGAEASSAVPDLIAALKKDRNYTMRRSAAEALGNIGMKASSAVPQLIAALKDENFKVRGSAAEALGKMGVEASSAMPNLVINLKDENKDVRRKTVTALSQIGLSLKTKASDNQLSISELNRGISPLETALKIVEEPKNKFSTEDMEKIKQVLNLLNSKKTEHLFINQILKNPLVWAVGIYFILLFGIFWLRPLWLLKIDKFLKPIGFKVPVVGTEISLNFLLLLLKDHPRVLDAWVAAHLKSVREEFQEKDTISNRNVHISIPVIQNGKTVAQINGKDLHASFKKHRGCLLIQGEGGVGKTSLACQIAKWAMSEDEAERLCQHPMLPVLIEEELDLQSAEDTQVAAKQALMAAIRGQVQDLTNQAEPPSSELLELLLRQRRILVIVDHFSEMSEATRKAIRPESPDFPINALIVTSRFQEKLGGVTKTTLKPLRIEGNRLSSFMESYLTQQGKRDLFTDTEFFNACSRLSLMVGQRNITALLAKLYAEQLIAVKVEGMKELSLQMPDSIPDLMLSYLNELNASVTGVKLSDRTVHKDARAIAWECLKQTFRPATANTEVAIAILGGNNAETRLKYLEDRLRLIQTIGAAQDQIRFALDPLAEYLAALHLIDFYGKDSQLWQEFLQQAEAIPGSPDSIKGFLLALRDCCLIKGKQANVPNFVAEELGKLAISPALIPV